MSWPASLRYRLGELALRAARRLNRRPYLALDYWHEASGRSRWGFGRPEHERLRELIAAHEDDYRSALRAIAAHRDDLARVPAERGSDSEPCWRNRWLPPLDGAALYAFVRNRAPERYVEVGAGVSTAFASLARRDGELPTRIVSIDPSPREAIAALADEWVAAPLQETDLDPLRSLAAGDIFFFDGSHRTMADSDVTAFWFDVLPELPPGVLVGLHDVFLPADYPDTFGAWGWSEQYLLGAALLAGGEGMRPVLAAHYASTRPDLLAIAAPALPDVEHDRIVGSAFWFEVAERAP